MGNATTHLNIANATPHRAHVVVKSPQPDGVKHFETDIEPHGESSSLAVTTERSIQLTDIAAQPASYALKCSFNLW